MHFGIIALFILLGAKARLWPPNSDGWHPYRYEDELAAIETKRAVPDAENAARRYELLFAVMDVNDEPNFILNGSFFRDEIDKRPWKSGDHPHVSAWLDSRAKVIDELLRIGRMEKCRWPVRADTYDEYTVPYKKLSYSVKLLLAAGNRDLGEGRAAQALDKYFCTLRIAGHLHQQPSQVDSRTGFGCERVSLQMIRHLLADGNLSPDKIAEIANRLPTATDAWPQEWEKLSESEKLRYMNLLGRLYEVSDKGTVRFAAIPAISPEDEQGQKHDLGFPPLYWLMTMPRDPHGVRALVDRYFAGFDPALKSDHLPRMERAEEPSLDVVDIFKGVCNCYRWGLEMMFFNEAEYVRHRHHLISATAERRGTWLVLGLCRYRAAHGAWPGALEEISQYVPAEAFCDPSSGGAFVYTLDGDSFRLYSKGSNRIDEGGRNGYVLALDRSEDDIAIWPPEREPEPPDNETMRKDLEKTYGKDYAEQIMRSGPNDRR